MSVETDLVILYGAQNILYLIRNNTLRKKLLCTFEQILFLSCKSEIDTNSFKHNINSIYGTPRSSRIPPQISITMTITKKVTNSKHIRNHNNKKVKVALTPTIITTTTVTPTTTEVSPTIVQKTFAYYNNRLSKEAF